MLRTFFPSLLLAILLVAGCQARSESSDDEERNAADRPTLELLVQSQKALKSGQFRTALALADSASLRSPDYAGAHFQRGRILAELNFYEQADSAYQQALRIDPDYQGAWFNLGNNAYRGQNYSKALRYYRNEKRYHPATPNLLFHIGRAHDALGQVDSAAYFYRNAIRTNEENAEAHARLGQLYGDEGDLENALSHSRRALELQPENLNYRYIVGSQLHRLGRSKEAIPYLERVTDARPWHFSSHYNLSQALVQLGRTGEAQQYAERADSLRQLQNELENLRIKAENKPAEPELWADLGDNLRRAGRLEEARQAYERALFLAPDHPVLRSNVALLYYEMEQPEAAVSHYRSLLQNHPNFASGWFNLGVIYAQTGAPERARKAWQRVLQIEPDHAQAKNYLAQLETSSP